MKKKTCLKYSRPNKRITSQQSRILSYKIHQNRAKIQNKAKNIKAISNIRVMNFKSKK